MQYTSMIQDLKKMPKLRDTFQLLWGKNQKSSFQQPPAKSSQKDPGSAYRQLQCEITMYHIRVQTHFAGSSFEFKALLNERDFSLKMPLDDQCHCSLRLSWVNIVQYISPTMTQSYCAIFHFPFHFIYKMFNLSGPLTKL